FTASEYEASIDALFGPAVVAAVRAELDALPSDEPEAEGDFERQDHRVSERHIESFFRVADAIAGRVASDAAIRTRVVRSCASAGVDEACLRTFVAPFLRRAHRRPADPADVERTLSIALPLGGLDGLRAVVFTALMAPDFIYRLENRGATAGDVATLDPFEL